MVYVSVIYSMMKRQAIPPLRALFDLDLRPYSQRWHFQGRSVYYRGTFPLDSNPLFEEVTTIQIVYLKM